MLGQEFVRQLEDKQIQYFGIARSGADINIDLSETSTLLKYLSEISPSVIINTAAVTSFDVNEQSPMHSYQINARLVSVLTEYCRSNNAKLLQISTDHYYAAA